MAQSLEFHDAAALLDRLSTGLSKRPQEVVFLVGAPLSSPVSPGAPGVPDVNGMIHLIRTEFDPGSAERAALEDELQAAGKRLYQAAFSFLQGRRGQQTANEIVCKAVLASREATAITPPISFTDAVAMEAACR